MSLASSLRLCRTVRAAFATPGVSRGRSFGISAISRAKDIEVDPTPKGNSKIAFSAPANKSTAKVPEASFPQPQTTAKEDVATPPTVPSPARNSPAKVDTTTSSTTDNATSTATKSEGSVTASPDVDVSHAPSQLSASDASAGESSSRENEENRGLGNFKRHAERKAEDLAKKGAEGAEELKESAANTASSILKTLEDTSGIKIPDISAPLKGDNKAEEFEFQNRALNQQEQNGVYVLAGLVVGGFLLGSFGKRREAKSGAN